MRCYKREAHVTMHHKTLQTIKLKKDFYNHVGFYSKMEKENWKYPVLTRSEILATSNHNNDRLFVNKENLFIIKHKHVIFDYNLIIEDCDDMFMYLHSIYFISNASHYLFKYNTHVECKMLLISDWRRIRLQRDLLCF